jgi:hypothetical protein
VIVEREKTNLPAEFVPWASGIVIASDYLLGVAGHCAYPEQFRRHERYGYYVYYECIIRERSGFWFIEKLGSYVLVFGYGSMPICTRTRQEAINLCEYIGCRPALKPVGHGLRLIRSKPDGILNF